MLGTEAVAQLSCDSISLGIDQRQETHRGEKTT